MKYDLHIHTKFSSCSNIEPSLLLKKAKQKGLDGIAVTDHNTIKGAVLTKELNFDKNFEVIIGEEIKTDICEVLAYYLKEEVKPGKFYDVIKEIKKQNAICVIAHPFDLGLLRSPLTEDIDKVSGFIDGLECLNGRVVSSNANKKALLTAKRIGLGVTGGSDAHFLFEVGKCYTVFNKDLREELKNKETVCSGTNRFSIFARLLSTLRKLV